MGLQQAVAVLRKEKVLLEQVLDLAACQLELIESEQLEDLETLLALRAKPMEALSNLETDFGGEMFPHGNDAASAEVQQEFEDLNVAIILLANQIAEIDERTEELAESYDTPLSQAFTQPQLRSAV